MDNKKPAPIYTTTGGLGGYLVFPYIFNPQGEWIGWITGDRQVYSVHGQYVGWLTAERRILGKRFPDYEKPDLPPPPRPEYFIPPAHAPLPPMMSEITFSTVDILDENPDLLPTVDDFAYHDEE